MPISGLWAFTLLAFALDLRAGRVLVRRKARERLGPERLNNLASALDQRVVRRAVEEALDHEERVALVSRSPACHGAPRVAAWDS
jgi:hypothetical protein